MSPWLPIESNWFIHILHKSDLVDMATWQPTGFDAAIWSRRMLLFPDAEVRKPPKSSRKSPKQVLRAPALAFPGQSQNEGRRSAPVMSKETRCGEWRVGVAATFTTAWAAETRGGHDNMYVSMYLMYTKCTVIHCDTVIPHTKTG